MKLQSTTDFVLSENFETHNSFFPECVINYANFLKTPLNKGMFVPCDLEGNVLEEPIPFDYTDKEYSGWCKAKERVLFKGYDNKVEDVITICDLLSTIEDLTIHYDSIELTESATKQFM